MKKKINTAICDAREVSEESLKGFESITINTSILITNERSRELFSKYPVTLNAARTIDVPNGADCRLQSINGKYEIGPDANGAGTVLMVNGKLTFTDGSLDAAKSFDRIIINGKAILPKSFMGQLANIDVNGASAYYPDGAAIIKTNTQIDALFIKRAKSKLYYCSGELFMLDTALEASELIEKGLVFCAKKILIAEGLVDKLISQIDEETELVIVPDGTRLVDDDLELTEKALRKYGTKLCVCGDVSIDDASALAALEYLYAQDTVKLNKKLEDAFNELNCIYDELKFIDPDAGYIADRPFVKIGAAALKQYPNGLYIEDCAMVTLDKELDPADIIEKLHIVDCAQIVCSKEQEDAVNIIAEDVASIKTESENDTESAGAPCDDDKDTIKVNAAEYKM